MWPKAKVRLCERHGDVDDGGDGDDGDYGGNGGGGVASLWQKVDNE